MQIKDIYTIFPTKQNHIPNWFIFDAKEQYLGRFSTRVSKILQGKETSYYTSNIFQGNYVIILNANKIKITGNKDKQKKYYRNSQRPGNLKIKTFKILQNSFSFKILENAIWGMLPKNKLGKFYFKHLFIYKNNKIPFTNKLKIKLINLFSLNKVLKNWIYIKNK